MKKIISIFVLLLLATTFVFAQQVRKDVIWAKVTTENIVLDGQLNETSWQKAESVTIRYGQSDIPTSGWRPEFNENAIYDPLVATIKFLAKGEYLYMAFIVQDSSVGGNADWARWDGILMNIKDKSEGTRPAKAAEFFYTYWLAGLPSPLDQPKVGAQPRFIGKFGNFTDTTRTPEQIDAWDAWTKVNGVSNSDSLPDNGYVVEMKVKLSALGYNPTSPNGEIAMVNFSIWDCDWLFSGNPSRVASTRTWLQGPWGNTNSHNTMRVYIRPDITINTTSVPSVNVDNVIPSLANVATPQLDGYLNEVAWTVAPIEVAWDNNTIRDQYPGAGPWLSGQFQPELGGNPRPPVVDPSYAKFRLAFKGNYLYLSADVNDQLLQGTSVYDKLDGVMMSVADFSSYNEENIPNARELLVAFGQDGQPQPLNYLKTMVDSGWAQLFVRLKGTSTVNNNSDVDSGFVVELKLDYTKLGYRSGDPFFFGLTVFDGDSFDDSLANYGTRTWYFRENGWGPAYAWGKLDPYTVVTGGGQTAQVRHDVIWAKVTTENIVLDGQLNETSWQNAESVTIRYGQSDIPTSGWRPEFNENAIYDPLVATIKFLAKGEYLYMAFIVQDSSVGGNADWARWDGILMNIKDKSEGTRPAKAAEFFYTYWLAGLPSPLDQPKVGAQPRFIGKFGNFTDTTRTPEQIDAWDAWTKVNGVSNSDSLPDNGYVVEMKVKLSALGYNPTSPNGEIAMVNFSIWDCDWLFSGNPSRVASTRTWLQGPWGNTNSHNTMRVYIRPDVTISTSELPIVPVDNVIQNAKNVPDPVLDGYLGEQIWTASPIDVAWDNNTIRDQYPGAGPWLSGQFQPELGGNPRPPVVDPSFARFRLAHKQNYLYFSADVNDQLLQGTSVYDKLDGVMMTVADFSSYNEENIPNARELLVAFGPNGQPQPMNYLKTMVDSGWAQLSVRLKGNSTVNNNSDVDSGFVVEMKLDYTKLGYRYGDPFFFGLTVFDGDSFDDSLANYGTRTWYFRENGWGPAYAWGYLDPNTLLGIDDEIVTPGIDGYKILGNYPNPFNPSTRVRFVSPKNGLVKMVIYNILGQIVRTEIIDAVAGVNEYQFDAKGLASGIYLYRVFGEHSASSNTGKMMLLK